MADKLTLLGLHERLLSIIAALGPLAKESPGEHGDSLGHNQLVGALRPLLVKHGICLLPSVVAITRTPLDKVNKEGVVYGVNHFTEIEVEVEVVCPDTSQSVKLRTVGQAFDTGDKGGQKAYTYAMKALLNHLFLVETTGSEGAGPATRTSSRGGSRAKIAIPTTKEEALSWAPKYKGVQAEDKRPGQEKLDRLADRLQSGPWTPEVVSRWCKAKIGCEIWETSWTHLEGLEAVFTLTAPSDWRK